ncbi:MAG: RusA family crossover junction endodeoxyribonuclease [Firmicutes bacterium]|nr:RusA family crossover junction endodeoxyribonuclease [Bacillota bacterium]
MNEITFEIVGKPIGKERPRTYTNLRGKVHTRTPERTRSYEELVRWEFLAARREMQLTSNSVIDKFGGAVSVTITVYYARPKSGKTFCTVEQAVGSQCGQCAIPRGVDGAPRAHGATRRT